VWDDLLDLFKTGYKHATGAILKPAAMTVDSGVFRAARL
jgi:phage terminase large subunit GpA-like protein